MTSGSIQHAAAPSRQGVSNGHVVWLLRAGLLRWSTLGMLAITLVLVSPLAIAMLGKKPENPIIRDLFLSQFALWAAILIQLHVYLFLQTGRHQRVMLSPAGGMASAGILVVGLPLAVALSAVTLGSFSTWSWVTVLTAALCVVAVLAWLIRPGSSSVAQIAAGLLLMMLGYQGTLQEVVLPMFLQPPWEITVACGVVAGWQLAHLHHAFRHHPVIAGSSGRRWFDRFGWAIRWRSVPATGTAGTAGTVGTTVADLFRHTLNLRRALFGSWWWVPVGGLVALAFMSLITWLTGSGTGDRPPPKSGMLAIFGIMGAAGCQAFASTPILLRRLSTLPLSRASALACVWSATAMSSLWILLVFVGLSYVAEPFAQPAVNLSRDSNLLLFFLAVIPCCLAACAGVIRLVELMPWPIIRGILVVCMFFGAFSALFMLPSKGQTTWVTKWWSLFAGGYAVIAAITHVLAWKWWLRVDLDATSRGADDMVTPQTG